MANSLIEDLMQEPYSNDKKKNMPKTKKSKFLPILLILLIIFIVLSIVAVFYLNTLKNKTSSKADFFKYLCGNNFKSVLNFEEYSSLEQKQKNESYEMKSEIDFNISSGEVKIDNVNLNIDLKKDVPKDKSYTVATLDYSNNELFNLEFLSSKNAIAVKSDEIVNTYIGSNYENLSEVILKIMGDNFYITNTTGIDFRTISNIDFSSITFSDNIVQKYVDILEKNIDESSFSEKKVTLQRNTENIDVIEYSMTINESKLVDVVAQLLQVLETDEELLNILSGTYSELGITPNIAQSFIDNFINELYNKDIDDNNMYTIKLYVNNDKTLKISIQLAESAKIDFEYEYGDTSNSTSVTVLDLNSGYGISLTFSNVFEDLSKNKTFIMDVIQDSDIILKLTLDNTLISSEEAYDIETNMELKSTEINLNADAKTNIDFKSVEVDDLTEANCLFIDTLEEQDFNNVINQIGEKCNEVINYKMERLSLIGKHVNPTVIEQQTPNQNIDENAKENAKNKLINEISNQMRVAQDNGEVYTIQNLQNLIIEGSQVNVNLSENIAVVEIDGYVFNIDSEFKLSE